MQVRPGHAARGAHGAQALARGAGKFIRNARPPTASDKGSVKEAVTVA